MRLVQKLATAALIAAALPAASLADDPGRPRGPDRSAPVQMPAPAPYDPRRDVRPGDGPWYGDRDHRNDGRDGWRDGRYDGRRDGRELWRVRELREIHQALRALELERDRFYATGWHRPREVRRFERSYLVRRAELVQRRDALQAYAWR